MSKLLSILLQKSDPNYPWGFTVTAQDYGFPVTIDQVTAGTLAAQHLSPGDKVIKIDNVDTSNLRQAEADVIISRPCKCIDLLVLKSNSGASSYVRESATERKMRSSSDSNRVRELFRSNKAPTESGTSLRERKRMFWNKCSADTTDYSFGKGFSRLSNFVNGPTKDRMSRKEVWRRCFSEERSHNLSDDCLSPNSSDSRESGSRPTHNVWSPSPTREGRFRFLNDSSLDRNTRRDGCRDESISSSYNRRESVSTESSMNQSYTVNSEPFTPKSEPFSPKSGPFSPKSEPFSPKSEPFSPKSEPFSPKSEPLYSKSEQFSEKSEEFLRKSEPFTPRSELFSPKYELFSPKTESFAQSSEIFSTYSNQCHENLKEFSQKSEQFSPISNTYSTESNFSYLKKPSDFWNNNLKHEDGRTVPRTSNSYKQNSEFKRSISLCEQSYSSSSGSKAFEKIEKINETKHVETSSSNDGKEERFEKSEKRKELVVSENVGDVENRKVVNDFKSVERKIGDTEMCNKIKTHTEESTRTVTPPEFYDNTRQEPNHANPCSHSLLMISSINENGSETEQKSGVKTKDIFSGDKQWISSTPVLDSHDTRTYQTQENVREIRQQNQVSGGRGSPGPGSPQGDIGVVAPPPPPPPPSSCPPAPPPPPPPGLGGLPTVRLSSEIPDRKKGGYEPPAAIQNAMMTKDKKPFTYTPGGLDLSEIRSPRMARRINRNANTPDTSVPQPRPSPLANQPLPPSAVAAMQPQIAIPVFPQGGGCPPQLHHVGAPGGHSAPPPPPPPPQQPSPPPVQKSQPVPPQPVYNQPQASLQKTPQSNQPSPPPMSVPKSQPNRQPKQEQPGSIYVPPIESQQPRAQLGSLYIPPIAQEEVKPVVQSPVQLNKAPTPWLSRSQSQREKEVPPWVNRDDNVPSQPTAQQSSNQSQTRIIPIQIEGREQSSTPTNTRIIPIQIEGANSPVQNKQPNFQQQNQPQRQQSTYQQSSAPPYQQQHQWQQQPYQQSPTPQQWQQQQQTQPQQWQQQQSPQQQWQQQTSPQQQWQQQQQSQQQRWKNQQPVYVHNKFNAGSQSPAPSSNEQVDNPKQLQSQQSWGQTAANGTTPVQSRSFRVLQKITDTDGSQSGADQTEAPYNSQGVPLSQLRKLQLTEDDRALMNKLKTQVDEETYLHNESDPRYRGSSIPSRAFRILQTMTGEGDEMEVPRSPVQNQVGQNRLGQGQQQSESPQPYIPPSEQQVQEPKKYTGSAIPSRSFRMLQAMTAGSDNSDRPGESEY